MVGGHGLRRLLQADPRGPAGLPLLRLGPQRLRLVRGGRPPDAARVAAARVPPGRVPRAIRLLGALLLHRGLDLRGTPDPLAVAERRGPRPRPARVPRLWRP